MVTQSNSNGKGSDVKDGPKPTKVFTETRYIFVLMTFLGTVLAIADRMALNVAIVGMVDRCKMHTQVAGFVQVKPTGLN